MLHFIKKWKYPFLVISALLLLLLFYLSRCGFPEWVVRKVEKKLQIPDLVFTIESIKFGLFQGITIEDIRCYVKDDPLDPILKLEKFSMRIGAFLDFRRNEPFSYRFMLHNGTLSMPLHKIDNIKYKASSNDCILVLTNISGDCSFNPADRSLSCSYLSFSGHGVNVKASGTCILPLQEKHVNSKVATTSADSLSAQSVLSATSSTSCSSSLKTMLEIISHLTASNSALNADIHFYFDPLNSEKNTAEITLVAKNCVYNYISSQVCILHSSLSHQKAVGDVLINNARIKNLLLSNITAKGLVNEERITCEELTCIVDTNKPENLIKGKFCLAFTNTPSFIGEFYGDFAPENLTGIFPYNNLSNIIKSLSFEMDSPSFKGHITVHIASNITSEIDGEIQADHIVFRSVSNDFADATLHISTSNEYLNSLLIKRFLVVRENQIASGNLHVDPEKGIVSFSTYSSLIPYNLLYMIFDTDFDFVNTINTEGSFTICGFGTFDYLYYQNNNMDFTAEARKIIWRKLPFENCVVQAHVKDTTVFIHSIEAMLARGILRASADLNFNENFTNHTFFLEASLKEADCYQLACNLLSSQESTITRGKLDGDIHLSGTLETYDSLIGSGEISIKNSDILKIPLFAGLFQHLGTIIPGVKNLFYETDLKTQFNIADGKICFKNITINGDVFSLHAAGSVSFDGKLNFAVQFTLLKKETLVGAIVQLALLPLSKALEFKLEGSLEKPVWRPIFIPK
jgi:hypothetical protein